MFDNDRKNAIYVVNTILTHYSYSDIIIDILSMALKSFW